MQMFAQNTIVVMTNVTMRATLPNVTMIAAIA
jgi:hypothetical protein